MSEYNIQMNKYNALNVEYDQLYPATKIENVDGLNTVLQNNDPRQWGLGAPSVIATDYDWDNATTNGFFIAKTNSPDAGWWFGVVNTYGNPEPYCIVQKVYRQFNSASNYISFVSAERRGYSENGGVPYTWGPWEWVNPPMQLGKEYRTTDRYLGKPVYARLLDCGLLVTGTLTYPHGISNIDVCVRYSGVASTSSGVFSGKGALPSITTPSALANTWNIFVQNFGPQNIDIYNGGGLTGCPVYVTVWYTKTTD